MATRQSKIDEKKAQLSELGDQVEKLAEGVRALLNNSLKTEVLIVLIQHFAPTTDKGAKIPKRLIQAVLETAADLDKKVMKEKVHRRGFMTPFGSVNLESTSKEAMEWFKEKTGD